FSNLRFPRIIPILGMFKVPSSFPPIICAFLALMTLATVSSLTVASEYRIVVPAPGKAAPYAAIRLELVPAALPLGTIDKPYEGFDFNTALRVTGDPELDQSQVIWSTLAGSLPEGLGLTRDGLLQGDPVQAGNFNLKVLAQYKTKTASAD